MDKGNNIFKYKDYKLEDFLADEYFIFWVKNPKGNNNHFWDKWIAENGDKSDMVMQAASIIRSMSYEDKPSLSDKAYLEIFENVLKSEPRLDQKDKNKEQNNRSIWKTLFGLQKVAAAILLIFCAWVIIDIYLVEDKKMPVPIKWEVRENPPGIKSTIKMGDGSIVNLNANSKLSFMEKFSDSLRMVKLEGEAFFDVEKEARPFIVDLGESQIEVMGTTFNVKNNKVGNVSVALVSGKVKVKDQSGNQVILHPSEMLEINNRGKLSIVSFDAREITAWKDKILIFKNSNKTEVIQRISNWYGVEIEANEGIKDNWAYSGEYHNESLENVLEGIKRTLNINYNISGKKVKLTKN
ncbi:FecR domain-containing protein [Echinicola marina]|uniref:FecR family protein n=1 Tax=Echinicola marina TaxID=2859768 RepID=UPI001CF64554|nr:FecR family protein [Echinicola marina]UCS91733.1 FecR domain-containing protein [Echinicola marina]